MLLFLLVALYQMNTAKKTSSIIDTIYHESFTATSALKNLRYGTREIVRTGVELMAGNITWEDAEAKMRIYSEGDSSHATLFEEWELYLQVFKAQERLLTPAQIELQEQETQVLKEKMEPFMAAFSEILVLFDQGYSDEALVTLNTPVIRMMIERNMLDNVFNDLVSLEEHKMRTQYATSQKLFEDTLSFTMIVIVASFLLVMCLAMYVSWLIARPVSALNKAMGSVVEGDLNQTVPVRSRDEIGMMSSAFNMMIERIREAIQKAERERNEAEKQKASAAEQRQLREEVEEQRIYLRTSVEQILSKMDRFAEGDLSVLLQVQKQDEIGKLFEGFNRVVRHTRHTIQQVAKGAYDSSDASREILMASKALAEGTRELSTQSTSVAETVERMASKIAQNSANADEVAKEASKNAALAKQGGDVVIQTIDKIRRIAEVVHESTLTVEELGASSSKIGEIVDVIKDIADQTNLLALNAAIEAARAGDMGRGFAVVADEVRKLAERTTVATGEIEHMVVAIQQKTQTAVKTMAEGGEEVHEGIQFADKANLALDQIIEGAEKIGNLVGESAQASSEIAAKSTDVAERVEQITDFSVNAAEGFAEIVKSVDGLNENALSLNKVVDRFNLNEATPVEAG